MCNEYVVIREYALFAVRNACLNNTKHQDLIRTMKPQRVQDKDGILTSLGLEAKVDDCAIQIKRKQ
jgi:hypothetical protein